MADLLPYATARGLMGPMDGWLGADDAARIQAYAIYEAIYLNNPGTFKLIQRGEESNPIYLPSARTIIEATNRFLAKRWTFALDPSFGGDADRAALSAAMTTLFQREQMKSKFATQKRWGLIRGDQVWHITADPDKPEGRRISVYEVDPAAYFPIEDPWNPDKILGVHLVDPVLNNAGKTVIKRQTYRKTETGRISYEVTWWETGAWDDRDPDNKLKRLNTKDIPEGQEETPVFELDPRITAIPVYHVKNNRQPNASFGVSEIAGLETLMAAVNQSITDEELTLALQGLGMYWTNSGPPVDESGNETNWRLGPGFVVEVDEDSTFDRVQGVGSVDPFLAHMDKIEKSMRESTGVPDIAIGSVDVQTAESGIALQFKMGPLLAKNEEKEEDLLAVTDHMLYDLSTMWFPVYESIETEARAVSIIDDPLPVNRKATLEEIILMLTNSLISIPFAQQLISEKLGYDFPDKMLEAIVSEQAELAKARNPDPFAARVASELEDQQ